MFGRVALRLAYNLLNLAHQGALFAWRQLIEARQNLIDLVLGHLQPSNPRIVW